MQNTLSRILQLNYVDFPVNEKVSTRYLRQEGDTPTIQNTDTANADDDEYGDLVEERLQYEVNRMAEELVDNQDMALLEVIQAGPEGKACVFLALMFRLRVQSAVFEVYMTLSIHRLLDLEPLQHNVDLQEIEHEVHRVVMAFLNAFEFGDLLNDFPPVALIDGYIAPLTWLACMIVRGSIIDSLDPIMEFVARKGTFDNFNIDEYRKSWPVGSKLQRNSTAQAILLRKQGCIGFYLPMGLKAPFTSDDVYEVVDNQIQKLEALFTSYFRLSEDVYVPAGEILLDWRKLM